jgi:hypothetical protein
MEKIDFYKTHKAEYVRPKQPALIKVSPARYLAIEGQGKPGGPEFQAQIGALFGAAYTIKMTKKFAGEGDFKVGGPEGLYWDFESPQRMCWKLLIRVPDFVQQRDLKAALATFKQKGKATEETAKLRLETLREGKAVQALHIGPYSAERETIDRMQAFAAEQGLKSNGYHHEIYISDPRRVPPERLKTILRQPVK